MVAQPITDFRGGLDSRKMSLALPAGTLITCDNAHINQGAEIEKRKAFVLNAIGYASTYPTFGACATPAGIVVFGSGSLTAGTAPTSSTPAANWPPSPMIYQMVTHPAVLAGTAYSQGSHALTAIVASTLFGQFAWAIAKFADGGVFCYYNGTLIPDFIAGVVLQYIATNGASSLASALASLVNTTDNYTAYTSGSNLDVFSLPGKSFSATVEILSASSITVSTAGNVNYPTATVTNDTGNNPADGSTVTIGGQVYRFKTTMASAFDVQIAATALLTHKNLYLAIGATGAAGTNYYTGTTANANVIAASFVSTPNPTFNLTSTTLLTNGLTENTIPGVSLEEYASTSYGTVYGTPAQGQFQIVAGLPSLVGTCTITSSGTNPAAGSKILIGSITYRFESTLSAINDVKIQATAALTLASLVKTINGTGVAGTDFYTGTATNGLATAVLTSGTVVTLSSVAAGSTSAIPTNNVSGTTNLVFQYANLTGGATNGISSIVVGPIFASGKITTSGTNPANNSTLTIGVYTYTFKTTLPVSPVEGSILIGATIGDTLQSLINAINGTGSYGVDNQVSNEHEQVSAVVTTQNGAVVIIARGAGSTGNNVAFSSTGTTNLTIPATLTGGAGTIGATNSGQQLLSATVVYPPNVTVAQYAVIVAAAINTYSATSGFKALAKNQDVFIYTTTSNSFSTGAAVTVTTTGQIAIGNGAFSFSQTKIGGGSINQITVDNNNLMPASISLGSYTLAQLLVLVANSINGNTAASNEPNPAGGYYAINAYFVALAIGNTLYISKIQTASTDAALSATATADGTYIVVSQSAIPGFTAIVPSSLSIFDLTGYAGTGLPEVSASCFASGGYPPYTYAWSQVPPTDPYITLVTANSSTAIIQCTALTTGFTGQFTCTVTDSLGNTTVSNTLTVTTIANPATGK